MVAALVIAVLPALGMQGGDCEPGWWTAFGAPVTAPFTWARGLAVETVDLGAGPELWVGGAFDFGPPTVRNIVRRTAEGWNSVGGGANSHVFDLLVTDLGAGERVFAAGSFTSIGGVTARRVAQFDGTSWSPLGIGLPDPAYALCAFDDGTGNAVYVTGSFIKIGGTVVGGATVGGLTVNCIARWDGQAWSALGSGLAGDGATMVVHDDGSGPSLFVGGGFQLAGGVFSPAIARWDGAAWHALDPALSFHPVTELEVHDFGAGPRLVAGRFVGSFGGTGGVVVWDGAAWQPLDGGATGLGAPSHVRALASVDGPGGPRLWVGSADLPRLRAFDHGGWQARAIDDWPEDLEGRGPAGQQTLFATGYFGEVEGVTSPIVAAFGACGTSQQAKAVRGCAELGALLGAHAPSAVLGAGLPLGVRPLGPSRFDGAVLVVASSLLPGVRSGGCGLAVAGVGELLLDTALGFAVALEAPLLPYASMDFEGQLAAFTLPVPADAVLAGQSAALQALLFRAGDPDSLLLTNAVVVELTAGP